MVHRKTKTRQKEVYGIVGGKGHGKDTLARLIVQSGTQGAGFSIMHFADALKQMCMEVFGFTEYDVNDPVGKEAELKVPIVIDTYISALKRITGLELSPHNMLARTPREVLQFVGSDYIRAAKGTYWLDQLEAPLTEGRRILVPDTRFPDEAELVRKCGGKIIRVVRIDAADNGDRHMSELEGLKIEADLILGVRTGDLSLVERVAHLISKGKWDSAMRYDYRRITTALGLYQDAKPLEACVNAIGVKNDDSEAFRCILRYYGIPQRKSGSVSNPHRFTSEVEEKQCNVCKQWCSLSEFNKNSKSWDLLHCLCRSCASKWHKDKYENYEKVGSLAQVFQSAKRGARFRDLEFSITLSDLEALWEKQEGMCAYTRHPMSLTKGSSNKVSIDRLDSARGYVIGNLVLCGVRVNLMKGPLSVSEFKQLVTHLAKTTEQWP